MKNIILKVLMLLAIILAIEFAQQEIIPNGILDATEGYYSGAFVESKNGVQANDEGIRLNSGSATQGSARANTVSVLDPVVLLLFGSGLVGLAGIGRKKNIKNI